MSLAERLREDRRKMNEEAISDLKTKITETIEKAVIEDTTSLHITIRLSFFTNDRISLIVNCKEYCAFDTTNILGTKEEKYHTLFEVLEPEGFIDCSIPNSKGEGLTYCMGFDI